MSNLKEKRKEQIILGAMEVFGEHGFYKGTVSEIAKKAGLGKGTIYDYFRSKDEIFDEMFMYILETYEKQAKQSYNIEGTAKEKITKLLDFSYDFLSKNESLIEQTFFRMENISEDIRPRIERLHVSIFEFILEIIEEGIENGEINDKIDKNVIALIVMNIVNRVQMKDLIFEGESQVGNAEIVDIIFKGFEN